ncbi:MAG: HEAT repeat domain-containing protein [Candidatus Margulisiibacteriota bacterium]
MFYISIAGLTNPITRKESNAQTITLNSELAARKTAAEDANLSSRTSSTVSPAPSLIITAQTSNADEDGQKRREKSLRDPQETSKDLVERVKRMNQEGKGFSDNLRVLRDKEKQDFDQVKDFVRSLRITTDEVNAARTQDEKIDALIKQIGNSYSGLESESAADMLVEIGKPAVNPLINVLTSKDNPGSSYAAKALGEIGDDSAIEPLKNAAKDTRNEVREKAMSALGKFAGIDKEIVVIIIKTLEEDKESLVRQAAMEALVHNMALVSDCRPIIKALDDTNPATRFYAVIALGNTGAKEALPILKEMLNRNPDKQILFQLNKTIDMIEKAPKTDKKTTVGDTNLERLVKDSDSADEDKRSNAIKTLGTKGEPAVPQLLKLLRSPEWDVRQLACCALGVIRSKDAVKPLIEILKNDKVWTVKMDAAYALGEIGDSGALEALKSASTNGQIKQVTLDAIGKINAKVK